MADWNIKELDVFGDKLFELAQEQFPKETKQFLRKQGSELNKKVKKKAKKEVKKGPDNIYHKGKAKRKKTEADRYHKGFKRGKAYYHTQSGSYAVRVYNTRSHAHLIEYGHVQLDKDKKPVKHGEKFVKGRFVLRDTGDTFAPEFETAAETFIDDMLDKGLGL